MAPIFVVELPYLSIGIAKVDIFSEPANISSLFFHKNNDNPLKKWLNVNVKGDPVRNFHKCNRGKM